MTTSEDDVNEYVAEQRRRKRAVRKPVPTNWCAVLFIVAIVIWLCIA